MSFYDENPESVELHKKAFLMLLDRMGRDQAASLYAGTKMAVDGLTKNNETFVAAYHILLDKERENDQAIESARRAMREEAAQLVANAGHHDLADEIRKMPIVSEK